MGTVTLPTTSVAVIVTMVLAMVMARVTLVGPLVGFNDYETQGGQELGELQATVTVVVCFGEELSYVVINSCFRLQQDKHERVSLKNSGVQGHPVSPQLWHEAHPARTAQFQENPRKILPPPWEALRHPHAPRRSPLLQALASVRRAWPCLALTGSVLWRKGWAVSFSRSENSVLLR